MKDQRLLNLAFTRSQLLGAGLLLTVMTILIALFYTTLNWMWDSQRLPLSKMTIQGELSYIKPEDVQRALGTVTNFGTFMSQDVVTIQKALEQNIPWVEHASVRKQWPDTLKIFLTEHQVAAIWNGRLLLDDKGHIFDADIGLLQREYVKLYGPSGTENTLLTTWRRIFPQLESVGVHIESLVLNDRYAWQLILDNGIRLELGKEFIDERIARFLFLYRYFGQDVEKISYVDLRYDTGAAVGWFTEQELGLENK